MGSCAPSPPYVCLCLLLPLANPRRVARVLETAFRLPALSPSFSLLLIIKIIYVDA
jgi:hypothetical protein